MFDLKKTNTFLLSLTVAMVCWVCVDSFAIPEVPADDATKLLELIAESSSIGSFLQNDNFSGNALAIALISDSIISKKYAVVLVNFLKFLFNLAFFTLNFALAGSEALELLKEELQKTIQDWVNKGPEAGRKALSEFMDRNKLQLSCERALVHESGKT